MALQSRLLRGDPALEACLLRDNAHIVPGAVGAHVGKIQQALLALDHSTLDPSDVGAKKYGASTASAVLAYKRRRNIVNRAYESQADNIVGKMTIAAIDNELVAKEVTGKEISCNPAPAFASRGFVRARSSFLFASFVPRSAASSAPAPAPAPAASPLAAALGHIPDAANWVTFAIGKLEAARSFLSKSSQDVIDPVTQGIFDSLNTHFHVGVTSPIGGKDALLQDRQRIGLLITNYRLIARVLAQPGQFFIEDLSDQTAFARAPLGGLNTGGKIKVCPPYLTIGPKFQTAVLVHESAHFIDDTIGHFASELPAPNGSPVDGSGKNYAQLTFEDALGNAYSYAQFALHSFDNFDHRLAFPRE
jgi:hypothetical protein